MFTARMKIDPVTYATILAIGGYWDSAERWLAKAGFSTYLARAILNHVWRTTKYTAPGTVYISLHDYDPTDAGLTASELAAGVGSYARASLAVADASWTAPATAGATEQIANAGSISFSTPSANWNGSNPIDWAAIYDAPTVGNMLTSGALGTPRTVLSTDNAPVFGAGALVLSLT